MRDVTLSLSAVLFFALATPAKAQFTDLQPGRNFPTSVSTFGGGSSENIDVGDVDGDGDLDVIIANGGDFGFQDNKIYINNGGVQGGTEGTFFDGTFVRFLGIPDDSSRDMEFVDIDNDNDLDIYVSNRGGSTFGQASRFYVNSSSGFYTEQTATRWGTLLTVPAFDQLLGGNKGPFRDWSCDCDFADLDDDGDLDLFHSSYGPNLNGTRPSRVFLNDGTGVFNEFAPWVDAGADIAGHTLDVDLVDLDGDFDFDIVMSSRETQARVYMNNLYNPIPGSTEMFTDTTQISLLDQGAAASGASNYEGEFGDLDGDGDFDVWMRNYENFTEKHLINSGTNGDGIVLFVETGSAIKGDANVQGSEIDFVDFDGDGDLDVFATNSGANHLYVSGEAQGGAVAGQYHRAGTGALGSLYPFPETPVTGNNNPTLDGQVGDIDGDGDDDLVTANENALSNRLWLNNGVPDTHAPTFPRVDATMTNGADVIVHTQLRDNAPHTLIGFYDVLLTYSIDGAADVTVDMFAQGAQQFRGVIPGAASATCFDYTISATDLAGNVGVTSDTVGACGAFVDLGDALPGVSGNPLLTGTGDLTAGSSNSLDLTNAAPGAFASIFIALTDNPIAFKGGLLHPIPIFTTIDLSTSGAGEIALPFVWPVGVPSGFELVVQVAISDLAAVKKVSLSNAVVGTAP